MTYGRKNGASPRFDVDKDPVVEIVRDADMTTLVLAGDLDLLTAPVLHAVLDSECALRPRRLVVDLAAVEFLDSSGLHLLLSAHRRLIEAGCALVLASPSDAVRRVIELIGLDRTFVFDGRGDSRTVLAADPSAEAQAV